MLKPPILKSSYLVKQSHTQKQNSYHILVDEVEDHVGETRVTPVAVHKQQLPQVFKPGDSKVTGHHSLGKDKSGREYDPTKLW